MIIPKGHSAAFGAADDGDGRSDEASRSDISQRLGISDAWATVRQVHGSAVVVAESSGRLGEADGIVTLNPDLPIAMATADCLPVVLSGPGGVGIAHAGWRGAAAGVVGEVRSVLESLGAAPVRAAIGPGIGPCCFEVGSEVADQFSGHVAATVWGTVSVDLVSAVTAQLDGLELWASGICTFDDDGYHSYRRDATDERQVAVAWHSRD